MKPAILSILLVTSAAATAAFAQEGVGQGPPHAPIMGPTPTTLPAGTSSTLPSGSPHKLVAAPPK
jgi:hypothetical protein